MNIAVYILAAVVVGVAVGYYLRLIISLGKKGSVDLEIKHLLLSAKEEATRIVDEAKKKADDKEEEMRAREIEKDAEEKKKEDRLIKKEELLDSRQVEIDKESEMMKERAEEIKQIKAKAEAMLAEEVEKLASVARLSMDEARAELIKRIEDRSAEDLLIRMQKLESDSTEKLERRAKDILATVIQRFSGSVAAELMTTSVTIPSEDIKGKIIGKEGRNIRAFEKSAGVELIVDDTPGTIVISAHDPVRRQVARVALENLIMDGRIQPAKIEELVEKAQADINKIIKEKGEQAVYECGIFNFDPRLVAIVGRLYFRTSYGQNVLQHSIEMSHVAGMLAEELGADVQIAKAGALVHDIGKALDHEVQGTHIEIGIRILQKFGADPRVIDAMKSHHDDYPHASIEAVIVQTADMISGGRPGARRDTVENYLKRLQDLEAVANSFEGIEKTYALSAGREIRVFVSPAAINDIQAKDLARDIAKKIEADLKYPGEIRVVLIRENRITEYAR
ncbi:MAG: ribonuclease Y [Candidatus Pacebacteria bacterium]|nr:ribonuclease Y [Candidatus Paceibacterota bacterium]